MSDLEPVSALLRTRHNRLDLGFLSGDTLNVKAATRADVGQIVTLTADDGSVTLARYDGTGRVTGLVVEMWRRV